MTKIMLKMMMIDDKDNDDYDGNDGNGNDGNDDNEKLFVVMMIQDNLPHNPLLSFIPNFSMFNVHINNQRLIKCVSLYPISATIQANLPLN